MADTGPGLLPGLKKLVEAVADEGDPRGIYEQADAGGKTADARDRIEVAFAV